MRNIRRERDDPEWLTSAGPLPHSPALVIQGRDGDQQWDEDATIGRRIDEAMPRSKR